MTDGIPEPEYLEELGAQMPPSIRFGASSWNYAGWQGLVYHRKYPKSGAVARMLEEYSQFPLFRTVGVDAAFYRPLSEKTCREYANAVPDEFQFVQKVWNRITIHTFTGHQDGGTPGEKNPDFLNADLFATSVLQPSRELENKAGSFVFEIQTFARKDGIGPEEFAERLDLFLSLLPKGPQYAVELRNKEYLHPSYLAVLTKHGVGHVYNSWTMMPSIGERLELTSTFKPPFIVSRVLLIPGRTYNEAVDAFVPYDRIRDVDEELRVHITRLAERAIADKVPSYVLVNNRAEGSAPYTTLIVMQMLAARL